MMQEHRVGWMQERQSAWMQGQHSGMEVVQGQQG